MLPFLTTQDTHLMDVVFQSQYNNGSTVNVMTKESLARFCRVQLVEIEFAFQNIRICLKEMSKPPCKCKEYDSGKVVLHNFNQSLCKRFIEDGGFQSFVEQERNKINVITPPNNAQNNINAIIIGVFVTIVGGLMLYWIILKLGGNV